MDTRIKLTKNFFRIDKNGKRIDDGYDDFYLNLEGENALFNIEETDNISLILEFSPLEYQIEIESASNGEMAKVLTGKEFDLHFWDEDNVYFPGYFDIYITHRGQKKRYYFCVHPKTLELENVLYLRNYVNDYYDGMSLDLDKQRKMKVVFDDQNSSSSDFTSYNFMLANYSDVINYMNRYVKGRYEQLVKKDVVSAKINKISAKSMKWLVQKGHTKNVDLNNPGVMLTSKTVFTLDNEQNRIFKSFVVFWDGELNNLLHHFLEYQKKAANNIAKLEEELKDLYAERDTIEPIKTIPFYVKKRVYEKIDEAKNTIESLKKIFDEYTVRYDKIRHFKMFTENIRHNTWINAIEVDENYTHKKVSSKELLLIKEIRDRYLGARRRISYGRAQRIDYFAEKSTPKLFETYLYVMLINILKSHGYEIDETVMGISDLMVTLSAQSRIVLSNDDGCKCEIIYDKPLEDAQKEFVESDYCTINSSHNRPDFILSFRSPEGEIIDSIVFEAKWRKLSNIYNEYADTEVLTNLKDYSNLCYYDADIGRVKRGVISKVIALYPDFNENNVSLYGGLISYCGLNICKEIESTRNYALISNVIGKITLS